MNISSNDISIPGSLIDHAALKAWAKKTDETIRNSFGEKEQAASLKLSREGKAAAARTQSSQNTPAGAVHKTAASGKRAPGVKRDLVRTGYASIDNTIIDSLNGVSDEIRQYAYDIVRNDFLLDNAAGISEDERQNLISLGLSEAQYVADNYLSGENAHAFLTSMKKVAGIAAAGVREEDGTMDYGGIYRTDITENGYTVQITDSFQMMKRYRPDMYKEYKAIQRTMKDAQNEDDVMNVLHKIGDLSLQFINEMMKDQPEAFKEFEKDGMKRLAQASTNNVRKTFGNVDTKGAQNFIQALLEMQKGNALSGFPVLTDRISQIIRSIS